MEQRTVTIKNFLRITKIVQVSAMKVHFQIAERSLFYLNPDIHFRRMTYPSEQDDFPPSELPLSDRYPVVSHHISQNYHFRGVYQLTAIGLRLGSGAFNLFGELGYGCLGIFRLGVGINL